MNRDNTELLLCIVDIWFVLSPPPTRGGIRTRESSIVKRHSAPKGRINPPVSPEIAALGAHQAPQTRVARINRVARSKLVRLVMYYTAVRLALIAGLAVIIMGINAILELEIPGVLALFGAVLLGFAISAIAFRSLRRRINEEVMVVDEKRRAMRTR